MAFKSITKYNEERKGNFFTLPNDNDSAHVVILYKSKDDVQVADAHYIKSANYNGYVHCCGAGCPACQKGIRVQTKLFIPLLNMDEGKVEFWDRSIYFESQLAKDVFQNFPNPSEFVFQITRHGEARSMDTKYAISATNSNKSNPIEKIRADYNISFPDAYSEVIKEVSSYELSTMLNQPSDFQQPTTEYTPQPRGSYQQPTFTSLPEATYVAPTPVEIPAPINNVPQPPTNIPEVASELDANDEGIDDVDF